MPNWYTINHPTTLHTHTMKPSDPLLLVDGTLRYRVYLAGKVAISQHLATPGFPQCDHTAGNLTSSHPQMSASHLLGLQGPQQTSARTKFKTFISACRYADMRIKANDN